MHEMVVFFIVFDVLIAACVVMFIFKRRRKTAGVAQADVPGVVSMAGFQALAAFAKDKHEYIANYVQSNWSGLPDQLPSVLTSLVDGLERDAKGKGLAADRESLKIMVATSLHSQKIARGKDVRDAMGKVA